MDGEVICQQKTGFKKISGKKKKRFQGKGSNSVQAMLRFVV